MSLLNVFDVSGTALQAQSVRLDTVSRNMANAGTIAGNPEEVYRAQQPVFSSILDAVDPNDVVGGVEVSGILESQRPLEERFDPTHPLANEDGVVFESNVNMVEEMASMISASKSYSSNVEVMNTSKQLLLRVLNIGR